MRKYLGEFEVNIPESPFASYTKGDWVMKYVESYGQIDGIL